LTDSLAQWFVWAVVCGEVLELMKSPEIQKCPGCGGAPLRFREDIDTPGMRCDGCGFSASGRDIMRADYLANFRPLPDIRLAAKRISNRSMLEYALSGTSARVGR